MGLGTVVEVERPDAAVHVEQQADGSVIVSLDAHRPAPKKEKPQRFDDNLAADLDDGALSTICEETLKGIEADIASRKEWIANYNKGFELLGLRIEDVSRTETQTSTVRHPLLLWSIIKAQSLANAELLPSVGPCKVENNGSPDFSDEIANDLQRSMNYYLTTVATEYYPDTDRALFHMFYGGEIYKKVYKDPIRRRPVSEAVYLPDLIVSQDATDLGNAARVTHRIEMSRSDVKKYQRIKYWLDIPLAEPTERIEETDTAEANVTGISASHQRREDIPHNIYECYTNIDLGRWDMGEPGQDEGIELPYRVTIDRDSQKILEVRRNWREKDPTWQARKRFTKWGVIPGIGFLCLGYLHLLGNHTRALTALERILIDAGIFSSFPGGLKVKGMRMESNVIRPGPGEFAEIDTGGLPIDQAVMKMPFAGPMAEVLALLQNIEGQGKDLAGQVDVPVGEGTTNVPVGTIMATIEQATQTILAVHKRLHQAQGEELIMMRELLCEQPELLQIPNVKPKWTTEQLASAALRPASDPNIPAHIHRIMQAWVLETLSTTHPELYNQRAVQLRILTVARIANPDEVLMPEQMPTGSMVPPDPSAAIAQLTAQIEQLKLKQKEESDKRQAALKAKELDISEQRVKNEGLAAAASAHHDSQGLMADRMSHQEEMADKAADRISREKIGMKETATAADQAAADREAEMDLAALNATTDHAQHLGQLDQAATQHDDQMDATHRGLDIQEEAAANQPAPDSGSSE